MNPTTHPQYFPIHADPLTWMVLGWNDASATLRLIFRSTRPRNTLVQKFLDHLEQALQSHRLGTPYGNGYGSLCENVWYQSGIEEAMLYCETHLAELMSREILFPRGEEYHNATPFRPPSYGKAVGTDQCAYCGAAFTLGWYCDLLVLTDDVLCCLLCCKALTMKRLQENRWLDHFYPTLNGHGVNGTTKHRPDCPIPGDYERMVQFLVSVPVKEGTDGSSQPPPVPEMEFVPRIVSTGKSGTKQEASCVTG